MLLIFCHALFSRQLLWAILDAITNFPRVSTVSDAVLYNELVVSKVPAEFIKETTCWLGFLNVTFSLSKIIYKSCSMGLGGGLNNTDSVDGCLRVSMITPYMGRWQNRLLVSTVQPHVCPTWTQTRISPGASFGSAYCRNNLIISSCLVQISMIALYEMVCCLVPECLVCICI